MNSVTMFPWETYVSTIFLACICSWTTGKSDKVKCGDLHMGQYFCPEPSINPKTQAAVDCTANHTVELKCMAAPNLSDEGIHGNISECFQNVSCRYTNGHSYETALLLSVFLGMFGIDRFYLGYPAIGLLKFCTLGFFFIFHLVDVILIATQVVGPADGSSYIIDYYGPRLTHITLNNQTFYKLQQ